MSDNQSEFRAPTSFERAFNRFYGFLLGAGIGFSHSYLLEVRGRKSGKIFSTPVDLLQMNGKKFLVAPRGRTQWVKNAEAAGEITLKRGSSRQSYGLRPLVGAEKPDVLKSYLDSFKKEVQRFFPIPAGSRVDLFAPIASNYPAFELIPR